MDTDVNYHARTSKEANILPLRRLSQQLYHYQDSEKPIGTTNEKYISLHSVATEQRPNTSNTTIEEHLISDQEANINKSHNTTREVMIEMSPDNRTEVE